MKKVLLLASALFATVVVNGQTVIWNGEDKELGTDGGFWNRADPTVVKEDGSKCLKITLKENAGGWADEHRMAALPIGDVNLKGLRRISMRIKMSESHNVMIKLTKEGDGGYTGDETRRWFWYDAANGWQTLVYEYGAGPNSDKIVDEGNTVIEIYPYEFDNKWGQVIYIDDIQLDGPLVNDVAVRTLADASLTDKQVIVTGSLGKGNYQNTWDGDWHTEAYDDYSTLLSKLSPDVCFLRLVEAAVADGDSPQLRQKNPNLLILSPVVFYDTDNVIRWDGEKNVTPNMVLNEDNPFYTPIDFTATAVKVTRNVQAGTNTFCFPFYVGKDEIGGTLGIYKEQDATKVVFTEADHADANVPFLMTNNTAKTELEFINKGVVNTPNSMGTTFVGVYQETDGENFWGVNNEGKFAKGGSGAKVKTFHAYLEVTGNAREIVFDNETTGINTWIATPHSNQWSENVERGTLNGEVYNLSGQRVAQPKAGLYIINGHKVVIK